MGAWIISHQAILGGLGIAILDLLFAISPNLKANGILHAVYLWLTPPAVPPTPPLPPTPIP